MSKQAALLLEEFEALPAHDRQEFAMEILRRTRELPLDSGPISDDEIGEAGKELSSLLDREKDASQTR